MSDFCASAVSLPDDASQARQAQSLLQDIISEGPFSTVTRIQADPPEPTRWIAIKSSTTSQEYARKPHDIVKEARLIALASHPNVCQCAWALIRITGAAGHFAHQAGNDRESTVSEPVDALYPVFTA